MLIKDKDIIVEETPVVKSTDRELKAQRTKEYKAHMREAWGDAFDYFLVDITKKYLEFRGRATRLELWGFCTATLIVFFAMLGLGIYIDMSLLPYYYLMSTAIPTLAVMSRRIHDVNRSAMWHLGLEIVLITLSLFLGTIPALLALIWGIYLIVLFSKPSDLTDSIYGEPNDEDEIYDLDNMRIINKFRFLTLVMLFLAISFSLLEFDSWNRNREQNMVISDIMEAVSTKGAEQGFSAEEINQALTEMRKTLKFLNGKEISEDDIEKYIDEAVNSVKKNKAPN